MKQVLIIEPYCKGFEHVEFNSAYVIAVVLKDLETKYVFLAEKNHLGNIRNKIQSSKYYYLSHLIEFQEICRFDYESYLLNYISSRTYITRMVDKHFNPSYSIHIMSFNGIFINILMRVLKSRHFDESRLTFIFHAILADYKRFPTRFWNYFVSTYRAIKILRKSNATSLVISKSIYVNIKKALTFKNLKYIEHPYIFSYFSKEINDIKRSDEISIGIMGAIREPITNYIKIASTIKEKFPNVKFFFTGHLYSNIKISSNEKALFEYIDYKPVNYEVLRSRILEMDYFIWFPIKDYKYIASSVLLDSFNYLVPGFYKSNDLIDHYFEILGEIGYRCSTVEQVIDTISSVIIHNKNKQLLSNTILEKRKIFMPEDMNYHV